MISYGVSLYSYTGEYGVTMTLDDCVEDVADLGATGLEILGEAHVENYPSPSTAWIDGWFARLSRLKLEPTCYGSWVDTRRGGRPMTVDEAVSQLSTDIRLAAQLGFRYVRPKLGVVTDDLEPDPVWEPATERVLDLAAAKDIVICPEIHWPSVIRSKVVDDYLAFIERTGTEHFGLLMDTGVFQTAMHFRGGGVASRMGDGGGRPPVVPVVPVSDLEDILDHVVHVQAKFYEIDDDLQDHYIPWSSFLSLLVRRKWSGCLSSEYEGDYAAGRASDQLRRQHALIRLLLQES
ncbi:sugar phosphate isomerase/epimerase family protein [Actinoplanes sp. CA-142083]|uniref:sugar phosphate isomerase/epimerase family protein n=1 Tax=Actinoplanes sp. CA-142083 TaxID=3239903 RepID=UPI003D8ACA68